MPGTGSNHRVGRGGGRGSLGADTSSAGRPPLAGHAGWAPPAPCVQGARGRVKGQPAVPGHVGEETSSWENEANVKIECASVIQHPGENGVGGWARARPCPAGTSRTGAPGGSPRQLCAERLPGLNCGGAVSTAARPGDAAGAGEEAEVTWLRDSTGLVASDVRMAPPPAWGYTTGVDPTGSFRYRTLCGEAFATLPSRPTGPAGLPPAQAE